MDFRKKLKKRLYIGISYIVIGLIMTVTVNLLKTENAFLSSFGFALMVCGIARIRNYLLITKSDETIRKQQIAETDERNIAIWNKARSTAFAIYLSLTCTALIVLEIIGKSELTTILGASVCTLVLIYWICYWIIRKRS